VRIVFTNFGTRGDFQPFLALGEEVARNGHKPVFAVPSFAANVVRPYGFEVANIGPELSAMRDRINICWESNEDSYHSIDLMVELLTPFQAHFSQVYEELRCACCNADVLVSGPAMPLSRIVHETSGIPFVSVQLSHFGGTGGPALRKASEMLVNPFRQKLGLAPLSNPLTIGANSPQLALYAMSTHLRPRPADWPNHYHITGFFFESKKWNQDPALVRFVSVDRPFVVVTFGSMLHGGEMALVDMISEAVRLVGCRAIVQGFQNRDQGNSEIMMADYIPHQWLFSRAMCVIQHGGAGTAAAVFRAGIPGVFVPHGNCYDQRYWAQLAFELGCAVQAIPFSELTAENLATAIWQSLNSPSINAAAKRLAENIRLEGGVSTARRLIVRLAKRTGLTSLSSDENDMEA
jgi:sterol 3beta-glucosyltransferase